MVIFLFPLAFSVVAAVMFAFGDYGVAVKGFYVLLTAVAAAMQFVPDLQASIHFLVPLFMQLFVCISWYFASQFE